ncbi:hypothetical protein Sinac_3281 [Singulisphaera acidiphila DSM 18658]|uniref:Uncharacterized protein n=1 Tax=Singulisphaera acidiphila (strain ATCC BAA-1392 / DSM 18658 / VKM B-2454 / MOB10) TaxID=886293 RepID=L0DE72_SINAD|nr:hypothetical protein Sinac_3281 [Singulisphaera acidiphila DSM 18658]
MGLIRDAFGLGSPSVESEGDWGPFRGLAPLRGYGKSWGDSTIPGACASGYERSPLRGCGKSWGEAMCPGACAPGYERSPLRGYGKLRGGSTIPGACAPGYERSPLQGCGAGIESLEVLTLELAIVKWLRAGLGLRCEGRKAEDRVWPPAFQGDRPMIQPNEDRSSMSIHLGGWRRTVATPGCDHASGQVAQPRGVHP